jgi:hypothetical protein
MSLPVNKKSFNLTNRITKSFGLIISNFAVADTIFFKIRDRVRITFVSSIISQITAVSINVKKVSLVISQMKLTSKLTQTLDLKRISVVYSIKERMGAVVAFSLRFPMVIISKAQQKAITSLTIKKIQVLISPILATFYTLGTYDPQTLGTLDTKTLGEMDYLSS